MKKTLFVIRYRNLLQTRDLLPAHAPLILSPGTSDSYRIVHCTSLQINDLGKKFSTALLRR
jgi:hypothetical protein